MLNEDMTLKFQIKKLYAAYFNIPYITTEQVLSVINDLDASKAIGIDGIGPKIIHLISSDY